MERDSFFDASLERRFEVLLGARFAAARPRLLEMGRLAAGTIDGLAALADKNPPALVSFDREGRRIDELRFHASYVEMRRLAYGTGVIAGAYRDRAARDPHVLTLGLGMLFGMAEAGLFCPICMTDGAARVLERFAPAGLAARIVPRLGAREGALEGAMWCSERQGGSDVGANETAAEPAGVETGPGSAWHLSGEKFFCSNLGAEIALVLARPRGAPAGTTGLGLFLVENHREDGSRNPGLRFRRLKDKLGTRSMPTGEVELERAEATLVAAPPAGWKAMTEMINLSRLYNAVGACAAMRRAWVEADRYAAARTAFGRRLEAHPLQQEVIADLAVGCEAATALVFEAIRRLDRLDAGSKDDEDRGLWRALTPLVKLWTGKKAVSATSEAVEALGGNGYMEDYPTPRLLRDAQVLPIWEGTTNILSLDFLFRACAKDRAHEALERFAAGLLEGLRHEELARERGRVLGDLAGARLDADCALSRGPEAGSRAARGIAVRFSEGVAAALLLAEAERELDGGDARSALVALRFIGAGPDLNDTRYRSIARCEPIAPALAFDAPVERLARAGNVAASS